jgi:hypothetical protein
MCFIGVLGQKNINPDFSATIMIENLKKTDNTLSGFFIYKKVKVDDMSSTLGAIKKKGSARGPW